MDTERRDKLAEEPSLGEPQPLVSPTARTQARLIAEATRRRKHRFTTLRRVTSTVVVVSLVAIGYALLGR